MKKVAAVKDWPTPLCIRDTYKFLGFFNYYKRFIAHFAAIAAPLSDLLSNKHKFVWGQF